MTVLSVLLDLTFSSHFMSDGSGSHCRMMYESPRKFSIFTAHIVANMSVGPFVSTIVDMPYPNVLTYMLHEIVTLYHWEFAVFGDALCSLVWFRLCFAFDA